MNRTGDRSVTGSSSVLVYGDFDIGEPFSAAGNFVGLLCRGLREAGLEVSESWDVGRYRKSVAVRYLRPLLRLHHLRRGRIVLYYGQSALTLVALIFASLLFRFRLVPVVVEWPPAVLRSGRLARMNARLYGSIVWWSGWKAVVISADLAERAHSARPAMPILVIPVLCDPSQWVRKSVSNESENPYVVYCADLDGYLHDAEFVVRGVASCPVPVDLVLIGPISDRNRTALSELALTEGACSRPIFRSGLSPEELRKMYAAASALLSPMRDDDRSRARFPSKIADYLMSGRPVVAHDVGEVGRLLRSGHDYFAPCGFDTEEFGRCIARTLMDPESMQVGNRGRDFAIANFDYRKVGREVADFLVH